MPAGSARSSWSSGLTLGVQQFFQSGWRNSALLARYFPHRSARPVGLFYQRGGLLVADFRRQHRTHGERLLDERPRSLAIGFQAIYQPLGEIARARRQDVDRFQ